MAISRAPVRVGNRIILRKKGPSAVLFRSVTLVKTVVSTAPTCRLGRARLRFMSTDPRNS